MIAFKLVALNIAAWESKSRASNGVVSTLTENRIAMSVASVRSSSRLRAASTRSCPAAAQRRAMARPIADVAPITRTASGTAHPQSPAQRGGEAAVGVDPPLDVEELAERGVH